MRVLKIKFFFVKKNCDIINNKVFCKRWNKYKFLAWGVELMDGAEQLFVLMMIFNVFGGVILPAIFYFMWGIYIPILVIKALKKYLKMGVYKWKE